MSEFKIYPSAARVNAQLTQSELAEKMGVSKQTVINWEKGKSQIGIPELDMLSRLSGIPTDYIFLPYKSTKSR